MITSSVRDYDPTTGLFTTRDPLDGVNGTTTVANPYAYASNDPLNKVDPLGLRARDADFAAVCGITNPGWNLFDYIKVDGVRRIKATYMTPPRQRTSGQYTRDEAAIYDLSMELHNAYVQYRRYCPQPPPGVSIALTGNAVCTGWLAKNWIDLWTYRDRMPYVGSDNYLYKPASANCNAAFKPISLDSMNNFNPGQWLGDNWPRILADASSCATVGATTALVGPGILVTIGLPIVGGAVLFVGGCAVGIVISEAGTPPNWP